MAVMAKETWSDERLTYFEKSVDRRFDHSDAVLIRIDRRFDQLEADIRELRQIVEG